MPEGSLDEQLAAIGALAANWDSYGAEPIRPAAIERCRRIHFTPTSDGGIQIELSSPDVWSEIHITPSGDIDHVSWGPQ